MRYGFFLAVALARDVVEWLRKRRRRRRHPRPPFAAPAASADLAKVHADAPGIDWFKGDVDAAFANRAHV